MNPKTLDPQLTCVVQEICNNGDVIHIGFRSGIQQNRTMYSGIVEEIKIVVLNKEPSRIPVDQRVLLAKPFKVIHKRNRSLALTKDLNVKDHCRDERLTTEEFTSYGQSCTGWCLAVVCADSECCSQRW